MTGEPAPLVPAEVDLRGYEFMPLYGARLRDSELNTRATDAEFRAAINLWWSAWNQVPAASLPQGDVELCRLADLGRNLRAWLKVKVRALHGFVICSDGRYYHQVLAAIALESWEGRVNASTKGKIGASRRWEKHRNVKLAAKPLKNNETVIPVPSKPITQACITHATAIKKNGTGNARAIENDSKRSRSRSRSGSGSGSGSIDKGLSISPTRGEEVKVKPVYKKSSKPQRQKQTEDPVERNRRIANAVVSGDLELAREIKAGRA